ncbi:MAG: lipid-A-disaccharide synthase [Armatimonadota bacterium]
MNPPEIFFVAGEPSGDLHASLLARELHKRADVRLTGAGGVKMQAAGVQIDFPSTGWGTIGVPEALSRVRFLLRMKRTIADTIRQRRPALVVMVDFGAFCMRLGRDLRKLPYHQPIMYYFPPSTWNRAERDRSPIAAVADVVATPFPWSEQLLRKDGVNAFFTGHPVVDHVRLEGGRATLRETLLAQRANPPVLTSKTQFIGLLPGSRRTERSLQRPIMLRAAQSLLDHGRDCHFLYSLPPHPLAKPEMIPAELEPHLTICENSLQVIQAADLILTSFGTTTLEAAAAETPMVGMYRGTAAMLLQYRLMRIPTNWYAMPNIIAQRDIVPEMVQPSLTDVVRQLERLLDDPQVMAEMRKGLSEVRQQLGAPGAAGRAADLALELMQQAEGQS